MVKKKRQGDALAQDGSSSTDSCDEDGKSQSPTTLAVNSCQHVKKSVDTTRLRKQLKATGLLLECVQCNKSDGIGAKNIDEFGFEYDNTLWLCLKCGTQLCGRARNQHALRHFETPHSDSHALTMNTRSFEIWCYECDSEVIPNSRKNLLECVELVKKLAQKPPVAQELLNDTEILPTVGPSMETTVAAAEVVADDVINDIEGKLVATWEAIYPTGPITDIGSDGKAAVGQVIAKGVIPLPPPTPLGAAVPGSAKRISAEDVKNLLKSTKKNTDVPQLDRLPRVRGLTNLGNTCFFNAVMQCLAQTPFLLEVLKELSEPGEEFVLPGGTFKIKDKEDMELPMIKGTLSSWGGLTAALAHALEELQSGGTVFTPRRLFDKLCSKCPQFTGGDQHDSHELLRQLLESVRSEDLKRYQRVILQNLGYKDQDINSVSEEMRQKCKIYGNQAADRILRPEQVFRGFLVSTLTCQECYNVSSRHEYFLDISLPVTVEKPQPPQRRKNSPENSPTTIVNNKNFINNEKASTSTDQSFFLHSTTTAPSKVQVKREKERKAKRAAKIQRIKQAYRLSLMASAASAAATSGNGEGDGQELNSTNETTTPLEAARSDKSATYSSSLSSSEHSDADIEDNLIEDGTAASGSSLSAAPCYFTDSNGNSSQQQMQEKRDDSPENIDKDSLEEDENDSGIATSPAHASGSNTKAKKSIANSISSSSSINNNNNSNNNNDNNNADLGNVAERLTSSCNSVVNVGISERGANLVRQLSLAEQISNTLSTHLTNGDDGIAQSTSALTQQLNGLKLDDEQRTAAGLETQDGVIAQPSAEERSIRTKRVRTQSHSDWSTTIAPRYQCKDGECSVQSCLNNFTAVELMTGNNKVGCESCTRRINGDSPNAKTVNTNSTKQFLISSPPAVLILHLKRFQLGPRCIFRKIFRAVSYPMLLDIAPFCGSKVKNLPNINRKQKKLLYALYGIVEHSGSMYGGHYTAYVKVRPKLTPDDKRWKFLPHGSKAELDQDDDQLKKLEELLAKEKARELRMKSLEDSDDLTSISSGSANSSANTSSNTSYTSSIDEEQNLDDTHDDGAAGDNAYGGTATEDDEASNVQVPIGRWYYVSDSRVQEVSEDVVLKTQAYLLFYERIY